MNDNMFKIFFHKNLILIWILVDKDELELLEGKRWFLIRKYYTSFKVVIRDFWYNIISHPVFEAISFLSELCILSWG